MKKVLLFVALACCVHATLFAQKAPEAVRTAFTQKFPDVAKVSWDQEKNGEWEAEFKQNGIKMSANFSATGRWLETETPVKLADMPAPVQAALKGKKIKETARIERADGSILYEAEVNHKDLLFNESGKMVR
jgi:hypothetical protein